MAEPIYPKRLMLRWRLDYRGRTTRYGAWDYASGLAEDTAAAQPRDGLSRAWVEAKDVFTGEIFPMVEVEGSAYVACRGVGYALLPLSSGNVERLRPTTRVIGIALWTADEKITAFVSGNITREPLSKADRGLSLREHSAGGVP